MKGRVLSEDRFIIGTFDNDTLTGGIGDDELLGLSGDDNIQGEDGNDVVEGGAGADKLYGGAGNDILDGDAGDDELYGGDGDDIIIQSGSGTQLYDGGNGVDTYVLKLSNWTTFQDGFIGEVNLSTGFSGAHLDPSNPLNDTVVNIENITLEGDIDFIMTGDDAANIIITDGGDDVISGGAGNDILDGGDGSNILEGGSGDDIYRYAYLGTDIISDSGGSNDILYITTRDEEGAKYWSGDSYVENGNLIIVSHRDATKTLTIENAFLADGRIEKTIFHAADGSYPDSEMRIASLADNLSGEYILYFGSASDDTLVMNDGYNEAVLGDVNDTYTSYLDIA